jgi:hypothetical protein
MRWDVEVALSISNFWATARGGAPCVTAGVDGSEIERCCETFSAKRTPVSLCCPSPPGQTRMNRCF